MDIVKGLKESSTVVDLVNAAVLLIDSPTSMQLDVSRAIRTFALLYCFHQIKSAAAAEEVEEVEEERREVHALVKASTAWHDTTSAAARQSKEATLFPTPRSLR